MFLKILRKRDGPRTPAIAECDCGKEIVLVDPSDNVCSCGRIYNLCGQEMRCLAQDIDPADAGERYDSDY